MDCTISNIIEDTGISESTIEKTLYLLSLRGIIEYGIKTKDRGKSILYVPSHRRSIEEGDEY
jgi:DNA-binding MarR family transcriptional regulator